MVTKRRYAGVALSAWLGRAAPLRSALAKRSAILLAAAIALPGCGGVDGVEFNGKIFESLGMSGDILGKKAEPRTEARAPLVLPPDTKALPEPGSAPPITTGSTAKEAWPQDRDRRQTAEADAKKAAQEEYCKQDGNWKQKAVKDDITADQGPDGSCKGSIFSVIGKSLFGQGTD